MDRIGFIGVGAMGGPMARHLLQAGYPVCVCDTSEERVAACVEAGASRAEFVDDVVRQSDIVCTSLPSSETFVTLAERVLLPGARPGQLFIDFGTVIPTETQRLARAFAEHGAALIDAPVSGGPGGAEKARLLMFVGGDAAAVERCRPVLETVGGAERLTCCGPSGMGQVVKGVNQLAMGLGAAAYLEAVAFGVRAGADAETIGRALGGPEPWRSIVIRTAEAAASGKAEQMGVKFRELPYYLQAAHDLGFSLPITDTIYGFCDAGERMVTDDNRPAPSFWHELMDK